MADAYIERYDTEQAEARREAKRKYSEPDEDGWITVTKTKKAAKSVKLKREEVPLIGGLNGKKKKVDLAYYTFQIKKNRQESELNFRKRTKYNYFQKRKSSSKSSKRTEKESLNSSKHAIFGQCRQSFSSSCSFSVEFVVFVHINPSFSKCVFGYTTVLESRLQVLLFMLLPVYLLSNRQCSPFV